MLKPLIMWGASGHAKVLCEFSNAIGYELVAVFDNSPETLPPFADVPLFVGKAGFEQWRREHPKDLVSGMVAIGGARGEDRVALQTYLADHGVAVVEAIHPTAFVAADVSLGKGCQILAQTAVCAGARLGDGCIINTCASVDHECVLGQGVHVAPGSHLTGCVTVGDFSLIGAGTVITPRINIGKNSIVGAGSVVTRDIPENSVAWGTPARVIRKNSSPSCS